MNWIKVNNRNDLPKIGQFLAVWKGRVCIAEYDDEENCFYICFDPAQQAGIIRVSHEREKKFTYYSKIKEYDYCKNII